jgi:single-strand DNA-binding protein
MTAGGTGVLNLRLASKERRKGKDDQWEDHTEWHSVVIWGKRGESLSKILQKGSKVLVEGSLRTSSWEAKDGGGKRSKTEIHAFDVELLGDKPAQQRSAHGSTAKHHKDPGADADFPEDDDIPF